MRRYRKLGFWGRFFSFYYDDDDDYLFLLLFLLALRSVWVAFALLEGGGGGGGGNPAWLGQAAGGPTGGHTDRQPGGQTDGQKGPDPATRGGRRGRAGGGDSTWAKSSRCRGASPGLSAGAAASCSPSSL